MTQFTQARTHMVQSQLATNGVVNPALLQAFTATPRELFVPEAVQAYCYTDADIDVGQGRYLLEPMVLAKMIEALQPKSGGQALVVGGVTGYAAAILAQLTAHVTDLDENNVFTEFKKRALEEMGFSNVTPAIGDLRQGIKVGEGFDTILVNGAVPELPYTLAHLLQRGGRLVGIVVPDGTRMGQVIMMEKSLSGFVSSRALFDAWAHYLPSCAPLPRFSFA